ncbi:type II toxin-antitoxin system PemK/MazF family toxin [Dietzia maris]|uniref:type II toxin-antitoxin system PemK/MazF family toxin n=1 Tax=Dietzia maris TaxID=37915 RepID=UPI0022B56457|nr:type II toxin-antitoxin system PemK/MazF family toxin [Dietzia maris]MCZ4539166.1 type II toxin-antitoxin system PemK/MazF family toxin [Dietzia maris]
MPDPTPGEVIWVVVDPAVGREQSGRRPAVVVSSRAHISLADTLVMVVPVTSVDRGWSNHVLLRGDVLDRDSWAMTEQRAPFRASVLSAMPAGWMRGPW